mmetsp:Transcript_63918/g.195477  ORF Transcript_63918/g.195477 Transcript_63918/m.195477 type:complete len:308 (+) Transcript_63918:1355-2278(+)
MQLGEPTDALAAVIEGIGLQALQLSEVVVKRAKRQQAVAGHVLGLVRMRFDLGLLLAFAGIGLARGGLVVVDLRQDVVQRRRVVEHAPHFRIQSPDDAPVARPEVDGRAREVAGASEQAKMQVFPSLLDRRQVNARAQGQAWLGRLRQILEGVLSADAVEKIGILVESAPVIHAHAMHQDRHPAHIHNQPRRVAPAVRQVSDEHDPFGRLEAQAASPADVPAYVHRFATQAWQRPGVDVHGSAESGGQLRQSLMLDRIALDEDQQHRPGPDDAGAQAAVWQPGPTGARVRLLRPGPAKPRLPPISLR